MQHLILFLVVVPFVAGCFSSSGSQGLGYETGDGTVRTIPVEDRGEPIALSGIDLDGDPLLLPPSSKVATVLNIWWSGCAECRVEAPTLRDLAANTDANFYGINVRESGREQAKRFVERYRLPFPSFYDPGGELLLDLNDTVPYAAIPTTVILDREMRVGAVILGAIPSGTTFGDVISSTLEAD